MKADLSSFAAPNPPFFHMLQGTSEAFNQFVQSLSTVRNATVRTIECQDATNAHELMMAMAEALEFPDYFNNNWDSLDECLTDLEWLPSRTLVLAFRDVAELLSEEEEDREVFAEILWTTAESWAEASDANLPMSFHILFHDQFNGLEDWMQELSGLGADFNKLA